MSSGSQIADVIRTLTFSATVALLGYLGYLLLTARAQNPPAQVVQMDAEDVTELKDRIRSIKNSLADAVSVNRGLNNELSALAKRTSRLEASGLPPGVVLEYGSVEFRKGEEEPIKHLKFRNAYKQPPIVLVCESGSAGSWVTVKSQRITKSGAEIAAGRGKNKEYRCVVGYLVIGQLADR